MKLTRFDLSFHTDGSICPNRQLEDIGCHGYVFLLDKPTIRINWPPENRCPRCGEEFYDLEEIKKTILEKISSINEISIGESKDE